MGQQERTDRGALLAAADVCVLPSRWEPFGTVMLEAWAAGTPLVAAASQGPAALISDGVNGLLVPVRDPAALADALVQLLTDTDKARAMGAAGRRRFEERFTAERMVDETLAAYDGAR